MVNDKDQMVKKDDETATSMQEGSRESSTSETERPNIDVINKRNADEDKQDRKSSYTKTGIVVLLIVVIVIAIYFFS